MTSPSEDHIRHVCVHLRDQAAVLAETDERTAHYVDDLAAEIDEELDATLWGMEHGGPETVAGFAAARAAALRHRATMISGPFTAYLTETADALEAGPQPPQATQNWTVTAHASGTATPPPGKG